LGPKRKRQRPGRQAGTGPAGEAPSRPPSLRPDLRALVLVALVVLAYLPVLANGYIWDDESYVQNNLTLRSIQGLHDMWLVPGAIPQYYPLVHTTFWIEYHLWGLQAAGYHLVNVLLHALAAVLLWRVLAALEVPGAWLAALLFGLHPVHVESVAWITERKNVLSGVLYLGSALAFLRRDFPRPAAPSRRGRLYLLSLFLFPLALFSKTVTATLPAALLLVLWWKRGRVARRDVLEVLPYVAMGIALGLVTVWTERHIVGAEGKDWSLSLLDRTVVAGRAIWFYLGKLAWPHPLIFFYTRWRIPPIGLQALYPVAFLLAAGALFLLRRRIGRGPLAALLFFAGTLFPALGFFDVYPMRFSFVADHFQYLASIGPLTLAAAGGARVGDRLRLQPRTLAVLAAVPVLVLGGLTWSRLPAYRGLESIWRDTVARNPDAWLAHYNLGNLLQARGDAAEAAAQYRATLRTRPDYLDAANNLGVALRTLHRDAEAMESFRHALAIDPDYPRAHNNLGSMLADRGERAEAERHLRRALEVDPDYAQAHFNLGDLLRAEGRTTEAIQHYRRAVELAPGFAPAHYRLGMALREAGRAAEARAQFLEAQRLQGRTP